MGRKLHSADVSYAGGTHSSTRPPDITKSSSRRHSGSIDASATGRGSVTGASATCPRSLSGACGVLFRLSGKCAPPGSARAYLQSVDILYTGQAAKVKHDCRLAEGMSGMNALNWESAYPSPRGQASRAYNSGIRRRAGLCLPQKSWVSPVLAVCL